MDRPLRAVYKQPLFCYTSSFFTVENSHSQTTFGTMIHCRLARHLMTLLPSATAKVLRARRDRETGWCESKHSAKKRKKKRDLGNQPEGTL